MTLSLVIPGLFGPFPNSAREHAPMPALPGLERLLSWGERGDGGNAGQGLAETELAIRLLGGTTEDGASAHALLSAAGDGLNARKHWQRLDPVNLHPDRDRMLLLDRYSLSPQQSEADALVAALNAHFIDDDWEIVAPCAERWYLSTPEPIQLRTHELANVVARPVDQFLPGGDDLAKWNARVTEIQMLMFDHPVNAERAKRGQHAINSVWLSTGLEMPTFEKPRFNAVAAESPVFRGAASLAGLHVEALPGAFEQMAEPVGRLAVLEQARAAAHYADIGQWYEAMLSLEELWFEPLLDALASRQLDQIKINPMNGETWTIQAPGAAARLLSKWRKPLPIIHYLHD